MKNLLLLLIIVTKQCYCQDSIIPLTYYGVVKTDTSIKREQLFSAARSWLNEEFKSYKNVVQINDKEAGELSVKGIIYTRYLKDGFGIEHTEWPCYVKCNISIYVKDGKYKYEFTDFIDECSGQYEAAGMGLITSSPVYAEKGFGVRQMNKIWVDTKRSISQIVLPMTQRLKDAMAKARDKSNW